MFYVNTKRGYIQCQYFSNVSYAKLLEKLPFDYKRRACSPATFGDGVCEPQYAGMDCGFDGFDCCDQIKNKWLDYGSTSTEGSSRRRLDEDPVDDELSEGGGIVFDRRRELLAASPTVEPTPMPTSSNFQENCKAPEFGYKDLDWPYYSDIDHFHVPFSMATFAKSALDGHFPRRQTEYDIPSMACPDCDAAGGAPYQIHKFSVNRIRKTAGNPANYTPAKIKSMPQQMFSELSNQTHRLRYFPAGSPNLVLVGPILSQIRSKVQVCPVVEGVVVDMPENHRDEVCTTPADDDTQDEEESSSSSRS